MSKVLVDRDLLEQIVNTSMGDYALITLQHKELLSILAQPAPQAIPEGYVLLPKQCPSWLEDVYDLTAERLYPKECPYLYLPAYDAVVKALEEHQKELLNNG